MARVLWIDARAGLAGDMLCAALLDAGGDQEALEAQLDRLGVGGWALRTKRVRRGAFSALHLQVDLEAPEAHPHRRWADIRGLIEAAGLPERAAARALGTFAALAEAEAAVHGMAVDDVAFHEVGAVDSIVDTVGACLLLEQLGVDRVVCSALPLGSGAVRAAHGRMSVPVPAVIELLTRWRSPEGVYGWPVFQDGIPGERVTPTGAALAVGLATPGAMPGMRPTAVGYGAGTRDPRAIANVVRVVLGEAGAGTTPDAVEVLEAQVDDMPGEWVPPLIDALLEAGALDAMVTPLVMKKGRPGMLLTALAPPEGADAVAEALLRHATTFGVRRYAARRDVLERRHEVVETPFGAVRIKLGLRDGMVIQASPEFEDCAARARTAGVPVRAVYAAALARYQEPEPQ